MNLARFPRVKLCHAPTPLEPMERLTAHLGGPRLWIKRDDCTGLATGGNKTRKLEFLMGEAVAKGANHIVTQGAVQSNHVRQTVAAAARLGMRCTGVLEHRISQPEDEYLRSGNVFLDQMMGANLEYRPGGADMQAAIEGVGERLAQAGEKPYLIPGGGSNPVGALGYVNGAMELVGQANDMGLDIDCVVHGTGSTGTQAGLVVGMEGSNSHIPVLGISVRLPQDKQIENVYKLVRSTAAHVGLRHEVPREAVQVEAGYVGAGYGIPSDGMVEAVKMVAQLEGIFLDPVYTGKAMAGLIGLVRKGHFKKDQNIVFLHTGGSAGLFGYTSAFHLN